MSNIFIPWDVHKKLSNKDCTDFRPLDDGTLVGDPKYCKYSFVCRQIGMKSDYTLYTGIGVKFDETMQEIPCVYKNHFDYLCTGVYVKDEYKKEDIEAT